MFTNVSDETIEVLALEASESREDKIVTALTDVLIPQLKKEHLNGQPTIG